MRNVKLSSPEVMVILVTILLILLGVLRAYSSIISPKYDPSGSEAQHAMVDRFRLYLLFLDIVSVALGLGLLTRKRFIAKITLWFVFAMLVLIGGFRLSFYLLFLVIAPNYLFFEGATGFYNMIDTLLATMGLVIIFVLLRRNIAKGYFNG